MSAKSFLKGLLIGGIAAGIATIITTPMSGKEVRKVCKVNSKAFIEELKDLKSSLLEIKDSVSTASVEGKTIISAFVEDLQLSLNEWKDQIKPHQEQLQKELAEIETTVSELETNLK